MISQWASPSPDLARVSQMHLFLMRAQMCLGGIPCFPLIEASHNCTTQIVADENRMSMCSVKLSLLAVCVIRVQYLAVGCSRLVYIAAAQDV